MADKKAVTISNAVAVVEHASDSGMVDSGIVYQLQYLSLDCSVSFERNSS